MHPGRVIVLAALITDPACRSVITDTIPVSTLKSDLCMERSPDNKNSPQRYHSHNISIQSIIITVLIKLTSAVIQINKKSGYYFHFHLKAGCVHINLLETCVVQPTSLLLILPNNPLQTHSSPSFFFVTFLKESCVINTLTCCLREQNMNALIYISIDGWLYLLTTMTQLIKLRDKVEGQHFRTCICIKMWVYAPKCYIQAKVLWLCKCFMVFRDCMGRHGPAFSLTSLIDQVPIWSLGKACCFPVTDYRQLLTSYFLICPSWNSSTDIPLLWQLLHQFMFYL